MCVIYSIYYICNNIYLHQFYLVVVLVCLSVALTKHKPACMGREGLFQLTSLGSLLVSEVHQGRNSRQAPGGRSWNRKQGGMLPPGLLSVSHSAASLTSPRTTAHEWSPYSGPGPTPSVMNQESVHGSTSWSHFLKKDTSSQMTPVYVKLAQNKTKPPTFQEGLPHQLRPSRRSPVDLNLG